MAKNINMELNEIVFSQIRKKYLEKIVGESFKEILENENVSLERLKHFYDDLQQIHKKIKVLKP